MLIQLGSITIDYSDICMVLGKLHKVNNDDMKNKECNDVINTVLRENSYIDIVQVSSGLSALKFCFLVFLFGMLFCYHLSYGYTKQLIMILLGLGILY